MIKGVDTRHTHVGVRATAAVLLLLLATLTACTGDNAKRTVAKPTTTTSSTTTTSTTSTSTTTTTTPPSPGTCPPIPARAEPRQDRSRYTLAIDVQPAQNKVTGTVEVAFTPDLATDRLVFRLWPNGPRPAGAGAHIATANIRINAQPATQPPQQPNATTLVVPLSPALQPGQRVTAAVDFTLTLPRPVDDRISRTGDAVRLGSFFPILSWEPGVGWAGEPPTSGFAEASTTPAADFTATITVPPGFDVLATGVPDTSGPNPSRWRAENVGDFAMSVGHFNKAEGMAGPVKVTVGVDQSIQEDPATYLRTIVASIMDFATRFGPFAWPAYTMAVEPNLKGGIEYPMHVMQGPGTGSRTTPHEVAHQWFYGLVENNQGRDPWLDEGLASWAEARHMSVLSFFATRPIPAAGKGRMGSPMTYWESRQTSYYRSVYVQPVQALSRLGPPDLVDCALRLYVARAAYRVARPKDLLDALSVVFRATASPPPSLHSHGG
jgi:hypothetical protein